MTKQKFAYTLEGIEFSVVFSSRRTIGISVLPDASVTVRAPFFTSGRTIEKIIKEKSGWIKKHRDNYRNNPPVRGGRSFTDGEILHFRGRALTLRTLKSPKQYVKQYGETIDAGLKEPSDSEAVRRLIEKWFRIEAGHLLPQLFSETLTRHGFYDFRPAGLVIRTMKRRWGSCSSKGIITLSSELVRLPDNLIEYVIIHELCHLKHHNHGSGYYRLLGEICPMYKEYRKMLRRYIP